MPQIASFKSIGLRKKKIRVKGFILVELLVVIAIISILSGMLLPALENVSPVLNGDKNIDMNLT